MRSCHMMLSLAAIFAVGCDRSSDKPAGDAKNKATPQESKSAGGHDHGTGGHSHKAPAGTFVASAGDYHLYLEPMAVGCLTLRVLDGDERPLPIKADKVEATAKIGSEFKSFAIPAQNPDKDGKSDRFFLHTDWIKPGVNFDLRAKVPLGGQVRDVVFENVTPGGGASGDAHSGHDHAMHDMDPVKAMKAGAAYEATLTGDDALRTGVQSAIMFQITEKATGKPASPLDVSHERIVHVLIVSADTESFFHIHPEDFGTVGEDAKSQSRFVVKPTFAKAGRHQMLLDFTHKGTMVFKAVTLTVAGEPAQKAAPQPDFATEKHFGAYRVGLTITGGALTAGKEGELVFNIKTADGKPVTDLGLYLGAEMHLAAWREDLTNFVHQHPYVPGGHHHHGQDAVQTYKGPTVPIRHTFAEPGNYHLFGQFLHAGKVQTADFWVKVAGGHDHRDGGKDHKH